MTVEEQAEFVHAAFHVWWALDGARLSVGPPRELAFSAFLAGFLATESLLTRLAEEPEPRP